MNDELCRSSSVFMRRLWVAPAGRLSTGLLLLDKQPKRNSEKRKIKRINAD
jgi:hypothetical protein